MGAGAPYYINLGRWADHIIGPFDAYQDAEIYIDGIDWRGQRPTVTQIEKPLAREWQICYLQTNTQDSLVLRLYATGRNEALIKAREILGDDSHESWVSQSIVMIKNDL